MRLGLNLGYQTPGTNPVELVPLVQRAEELGFDSVWAAESWGTDAVTVLAWMAACTSRIKVGSAIMQIPGRSPANTAMTAATLDLMSGGRFLLGLGTSGPQVVEGWHGQPWGKPLRAEIPIYLAAIGPKNVALAFEIADGWLPIFVVPERFQDAYGSPPEGFEIAATVNVLVGDDVDALRNALKPHVALYVGGMGAKGKNFYNALVSRYGWEAEAARIQELYLAGKHREAIAAVPDELVDAVSLVGPKERIRERLDAWRHTPITTLLVGSPQPEALETLAELLL
jgi:alkanesulfonate monooxygenase SsuD/methylene tetrahydromethanopterin reductase-like flavin-dependent oxidoreductase (luciferase family)